jgi:hypothetical protein
MHPTDAFKEHHRPALDANAMKTERDTHSRKAHIENRRLFNMASGRLRLWDWEDDHLQSCEICQGVFYVLLNQVDEAVSGSNQKPAHDAA